MAAIEIKNGFIDFAKIDFKCPNCNKQYNDQNDKYLNRCQNNKSGYTKIKCKCGKPFFMTYNYMGDAVSFL
jgi:transposase-like protein